RPGPGPGPCLCLGQQRVPADARPEPSADEGGDVMDVIARLRTAAQEARSRVAAEASAAGALPRDRCRLQALRRAAQGGGGATELRGGTVGPGLVDLLAELTRRGILRCAHGRD